MNQLARLLQWLRAQRLRWFGPRQSAPIHHPMTAGRSLALTDSSAYSVLGRADSPSEPRAERGWHDISAFRPGGESPTSPSNGELLVDLQQVRNLRFGEMVGRAGGQGAVCEVVGFPGYVYKRYRTPLVGAVDSFDELVAAGQALVPHLDRAGVTAVWPIVVCGVDRQVEGYLMRRIPDRFTLEMATPYGRRIADATLDHALAADPSKKFYPARAVQATERLEIVRLVGVFLDTLHRNDLVYGDLSLKNLRFSLDPVRLLVMDLDGVHRISSPLILGKDHVHTPDWFDPVAPDQIPLGFDLDRYRFSLLVYRMLVANSVSAALPGVVSAIAVPSIGGLDESRRSRVELLLRRAASGGHGARPPICEWLDALGASSRLSAM